LSTFDLNGMAVVVSSDEGDIAGVGGWANIPHVALLSIFQYLSSPSDRLQASSVCRRWRSSVFQLQLRSEVKLKIESEEDLPRTEFLASNLSRKAVGMEVTFNPKEELCVEAMKDVLFQLETSWGGLKSLKVLALTAGDEEQVQVGVK
jgi:hypothetical protein